MNGKHDISVLRILKDFPNKRTSQIKYDFMFSANTIELPTAQHSIARITVDSLMSGSSFSFHLHGQMVCITAIGH